MEDEKIKTISSEPVKNKDEEMLNSPVKPISTFLQRKTSDNGGPVNRNINPKNKPPRTFRSTDQQFLDIDSRQVRYYGDYGVKSFLPDEVHASQSRGPIRLDKESSMFPRVSNDEAKPTFAKDQLSLEDGTKKSPQSITSTLNDVESDEVKVLGESQNYTLQSNGHKPQVKHEDIEEGQHQQIKATVTGPYTILKSDYDKEKMKCLDCNESSILKSHDDTEFVQLHDDEMAYDSNSPQPTPSKGLRSPQNTKIVDRSCDDVDISFENHHVDIGVLNPYFEEGSFTLISSTGKSNNDKRNINNNNNSNDNINENNSNISSNNRVSSKHIFYGDYKDTNSHSLVLAPTHQQKDFPSDSKSLGKSKRGCVVYLLIFILVIIPASVVILIKVKGGAMKQGQYSKYLQANFVKLLLKYMR